MYPKIKRMLFLFICIFLFFVNYSISSGEEPGSASGICGGTINQDFKTDWEPTTSVFVELLGKSWCSLNVDFRKKATSAIGVGIAIPYSPTVMYYRFFGSRFRLETGAGLTGMLGTNGLKYVAINGSVGYRYQKKKGMLFRIGFAPLLGIPIQEDDKLIFIPWGQVSLGYSF